MNILQRVLANRFNRAVRFSVICALCLVGVMLKTPYVFAATQSDDYVLATNFKYINLTATQYTTIPAGTYVPDGATFTSLTVIAVMTGSSTVQFDVVGPSSIFCNKKNYTPNSNHTFGTGSVAFTIADSGSNCAGTLLGIDGGDRSIGVSRISGTQSYYFQKLIMRVTYEIPEIFTLTNETGTIRAGQETEFKVNWQNIFGYPSPMRYLYFFPYGKPKSDDGENVIYCGLDTECPTERVTIVENVAQPDALTASGSVDFSYVYDSPYNGTGSVLASSNCNLQQMLEDIDDVCNAFVTHVALSSVVAEKGVPDDIISAAHVWAVGGGTSTGAYFAADPGIVEIGQPVYLKWRFDAGDLVISSVKIFSGTGALPVLTLDESNDVTQNVSHYATIYYSSSGEYWPWVRLCVSDCSSIYVDIFLGGTYNPNPYYSITVLSTSYQGAGGTQLPGGSCATTGAFGLNSSNFRLTFGTGSNVYVKGAVDVGNKAIDSFFWLAGNMFCLVSKAPFIADIKSVVAPEPGSYILSTTLLNREFTSEELYGRDSASYTVSYNESDEAHELWELLAPFIFAGIVLEFILFEFHKKTR